MISIKKKVIILTILVLTATSLFSQNCYPQKIVLNKDTIIAISKTQLRQINIKLLDLEKSKIYINELEGMFNKSLTSNERQISLNRLLYKKNNNLFIENSDLIKLNETNSKLQEYYKKEIKSYKQKQIKVAVVGGLVGISVTSIMFLILN